MLATAIVLSLVPQGFPERAPQRGVGGLVDPGLHGGRIKDQEGASTELFDDTIDVTPDGRIRVSFRQQWYVPKDSNVPPIYHWALVATAVDTVRIRSTTEGLLDGFYDAVVPSEPDEPFGQDFAFGALSESKVIFWSPAFDGADTETNEDDVLCTLDPGLPLPNGGATNVTLAMMPLPASEPHGGENPYPSDELGNFDLDEGCPGPAQQRRRLSAGGRGG